MIKIELEVTPQQMIDIAAIMSGGKVTQESNDETGSVATAFAAVTSGMGNENADNANDGQTTSASVTTATSNDDPPPPPSTNTEVELGKGLCGELIPWDARIHGKAKKKNADGSWRLAQGIDRETYVPTVEAELITAMHATPAATAEPSVESTNDDPPPPPSNEPPKTFPELLPLITAAKAKGTLNDEGIAKAVKELGLTSFGLIATRPDLVPQMAQKLGLA